MGTLNILRSPIANEHGGANMKSSPHRRRLMVLVAVAAIGGLSAGVVPQFATATRPHPRSLGVVTAATPAALPVVAAANCEGDASCDVSLYAKPGTATAGATTLPIWGFTTDNAGGGFLGGNPANTIVMDEGQTLNLDLHNCLPAGAGDLYIEMPAVAGPPPPGAAAVDSSPDCSGAGTMQTFTVTVPGTYVYEAGATVEQERQLAMGLGALVVVRPTGYSAGSPTAYDGGMGAYNDEALVVMNEIDPKFNADPFTGDVEDYNPQYFFINGKAHPNTDDIGANAGDTVLLRAANLGIRDRALGLLNARLNLRAIDSHKVDEEPATVDLESQLLTPGQVVDLSTQIDVAAPAGTQFPVLDLDRELTNGSQPGIGGMLAFIDVLGTPPPASNAVATVTDLTPATNDGTSDGTNDITVSVTFSGGTTSAVWYVDSSPTTHNLSTVTGDGATTVTVPIATVIADGAVTGDHIIWILPSGSSGPGTKSGGAFTLALEGPSVFGLSVDPPFANLSLNKVDGTFRHHRHRFGSAVAPRLPDRLRRVVPRCSGMWHAGRSGSHRSSRPVACLRAERARAAGRLRGARRRCDLHPGPRGPDRKRHRSLVRLDPRPRHGRHRSGRPSPTSRLRRRRPASATTPAT